MVRPLFLKKLGEIKMRQDYASVIKYLADVSSATIYLENVKEMMKLPALYIELPETSFSKAVLDKGYAYDNQLFVQVFHISDSEAYNLAFNLIQNLMQNGCYIPIVNKEGQNTGTLLHLDVRNIRKIDLCHSQIELSWKNISKFVIDDIKMKKLNITINTKGVE